MYLITGMRMHSTTIAMKTRLGNTTIVIMVLTPGIVHVDFGTVGRTAALCYGCILLSVLALKK